MRDEAARVEVRRVHLVGDDVLLAHIEVWLRLRVRNVAILRIRIRALLSVMAAANPLLIETVHLAIGAGEAAGAVAGLEERGRAMIEIPAGFQSDRRHLDLLIRRVVAILHGFRARETVEQIIERAILLHDDDDMLDFAARRRVMDPLLQRCDLRRMCHCRRLRRNG